MCAAGGRSEIASQLMQNEGYSFTIFQMDLVVMVKTQDGKM